MRIHLVWALVWKIEYLGMFWWLCALCEFLDASTDAYEGEEAEVYEEEEEPCANCTNCVNCTNQGKLILVQASKDTSQFI